MAIFKRTFNLAIFRSSTEERIAGNQGGLDYVLTQMDTKTQWQVQYFNYSIFFKIYYTYHLIISENTQVMQIFNYKSLTCV